MGNVINVVLFNEVKGDNPRTGANYFVDPPTVPQYVAAFLLRHHNSTFLFNGFLVTRDSHDQVHVGEQVFGLFENTRVANVVHIKDAVGIHAHWLV